MRNSTTHHLVVVGGGVAGLELASTLARQSRRDSNRDQQIVVTLVDRDSAHVWKPMLHTIAAGTQETAIQQTPYLAQARRAGFVYRPGELAGVDAAAGCLTLAAYRDEAGQTIVPETQLSFDTLVLAVGSRANDFRTPGVAEYCSAIDTREQAERFNRALRLQITRAVALDLPLSVAIVGGGATGVELAAEVVQLADGMVGYGVSGLKDRLAVTLIEAGPRLLAGFPEDIAESTLVRLQALGVDVLLDSRVRKASQDYFDLGDGHTVAATLKVWAAGVKGPDVLAQLDMLEVTQSNLIQVLPSLQSTAQPHIFAIGDCAALVDASSGRNHPPTAQVAHQQARHLIKHLPAFIHHATPIPAFRYRHMGSLVSLGDYDAFASLGKTGLFDGVTLRGRLAHLSHRMLYRSHQSRIHGFWRGTLLWLIDQMNARVRPPIRLD